MEFQLQLVFVELGNLLKVLKLVANGAEARQNIQSGAVKVNGQVETAFVASCGREILWDSANSESVS